MSNRYFTSGAAPRAAAGAPHGRLRALVRASLAGALALLLLPLAAEAQRKASAPVTSIEVDDGHSPSAPLPRSSGFNLFAEEDRAVTGMHMTGGYGWVVTNTGPCAYYGSGNGYCGQTLDRNGNVESEFFEFPMLAGAPISEYRKIRAVHPGVALMKDPVGYTAPHTFNLATPQSFRWGPGDGQFGVYFSGNAASTADGSCQDNSDYLSGYVSVGRTLLAGSDCPPTWPRQGFKGLRPLVSDSVVAYYKGLPDKSRFRFDEWRFPAAAFDTTQFRGNFSTYGLISDSYRDIIQRFGGVTKLGAGAPTERGYPLGLDVRFDAYQFARPSIRNAVFWQVTIVNRSDRIYERGIDYDSLYFGVEPGILIGGQAQGSSMYQDIGRNTNIIARGNLSGQCTATRPRRTAVTGGCATTDGPTRPIWGITFLKSPIGDERNKMLSDPTSAFYDPNFANNPLADDTITFNHVRRNGFGGLYNATFARSDRALFGYMASKETEFLDGRSINDFTPTQFNQFFYNENFQGVIDPAVAKFNRFVPSSTNQPNTADVPHPGQPYGKWDYNNDGIPDTIYTPGCGSRGCHGVYSDTMASGVVDQFGNVGNIISAGPFKLKAGDTTQFIMAFTGAPDSLSFETLLNAVLKSYKGFYAGPGAYPVPNVAAEVTPATVRDSLNGTQDAQVRIRITPKVAPSDPFVIGVLNTLQTSTKANIVRLVRLNPGLISAVQARVRPNWSQLLIFKSCDRGQTFTVTASCAPAYTRNTNGTNIGFGFQPYAVINVDSTTGLLARNTFTDNVQPGRTYLYSFVTRTRGLADIPVVDTLPGGGGFGPTTLAKALGIDADTIASPLARSGPTTVTVYAPITLPNGTSLAKLDTATVTGTATQRIIATARSTVSAGRYRTIFANRFILRTTVDTARGTRNNTVVAQRFLAAAATSPTGTVTKNFLAGADTLTGPGTVIVDPTLIQTRRSTSGSVITYVDTIDTQVIQGTGGLGFVLARDSVGASIPYFISANPSSQSTTAYEGSPSFPGVLVAPVTEVVPRLGVTVRGVGDTLNTTVINNNAVVLLNPTTTLSQSAGGRYIVNWADDAFGPQSPFTFGTVAQLQPVIYSSLNARYIADRGDTTAATRAVLAAAGITTRKLLAARFPFTITAPNGSKATLAFPQRHTSASDSVLKNSILLGTGGDTSRVQVPADLWLPGDTLYVIETARHDSTAVINKATVSIVRDSVLPNGHHALVPIQVVSPIVGLRLTLGCTNNTSPVASPPRNTCNPIRLDTRGATGYYGYQNGYKTVIDFARPFDLFSEVRLTATPQTASASRATTSGVTKIRVVPNPYVVQSQYDQVDAQRNGTPRIYFTNVPEEGSIRIYTVSGQFVQQLSWTAADLTTSGSGALNGDLPFNLRSREGLELGSGLYLYVITPHGRGVGPVTRGKFVIIR